MIKQEQPLKNRKAVNIANKMGKRYTLLDAMLMGKKLKIDWKKEKFGIGDLLVGMHYELEHGKVDASTNVTDDNAIKTAKIAWAHLKERPDYYVQLMKIDPPKKMEKKASEMLEDMVFEKQASLKKLRPIQCEQCGYEGRPTRQGFCPECMAICGVMPKPAHKKPEKGFDNEPVNGNSVEDQWQRDSAEINGYMI